MEAEITIDGVDLVVTYTATPYDPGQTWGPPEVCYPPEGGEVEVELVRVRGSEADISHLLGLDTLKAIEEHVMSRAA